MNNYGWGSLEIESKMRAVGWKGMERLLVRGRRRHTALEILKKLAFQGFYVYCALPQQSQ